MGGVPPDRTFRAHGALEPDTITGGWWQRGDSIFTRSQYGHAITLVLRGGVPRMDDGTRLRRSR